MAKGEWKKQGGGNYNPMIDIKEEVGKETVGVYKGSRKVNVNGDESIVHTIEIDKVENDFWGAGQLNYLLKEVEAGTEVRIVYKGKESVKIKVGKKNLTKEVHQFEVFTR